MDNQEPNGYDRKKIVEDLWDRTISAIPSHIGKLAYLSSLRDSNSGRYNHYGLETIYSAEESDITLREAHLELFYEWLKKPLQDQKEDLELYFRTVEGELDEVLENWKLLEPYRSFIPADADAAGRRLYLDDVGIILDLMQSELFPPAPRQFS